MQRSVDDPAGETHVRLEEDHSTAVGQHAPALLKRRARIAKVMEHIEQDQVRTLAVLEAQRIRVFDLIDPWIREQVGANTARDDVADVADPRAELDDLSGHG